jgi:hypothetical protein
MHAGKDDKSIVKKAVEAVKEFAATVSEAADKAMEPESTKPSDEVVVMPMAITEFPGDTAAPPVVVVRERKSARKSRAMAAKRTAKKSIKKTKKTKKAAKKSKLQTGRKAVGKKTKKA